METLGEKLHRLRKQKDLTLVQVAQAIQVNKSAVSFWENNTNEPKASYIKRLAIFYDVTSDYLLGLEDESGTKIYR